VLDRYRLRRRLGAGGFGTVWLARDERLDRDVAVKIVAREWIVGGRFEQEARAAARLAHPGIVTLYEAAVDDDGAYLVSELVRGATLGDLLQRGQLSDRDVVAIALGLCDALAHAHAQGVVHRDVKPSNVLVPDRPAAAAATAKLTDFGVARLVGGDSLTRTGDVIGTAAYMAPEQAAGLQAAATADLYSLALVTYEALTGVNPQRTAAAAQAAHHVKLDVYLPPLRRQRRELPRQLGQAIDLALRPRPGERGSVEELHQSLSAALGDVGDRPGVVTAAWPRPSWSAAGPREAGQRLPGRDPADPPPSAEPAVASPAAPGVPAGRWPARGLAALATAALSAWLVAHVITTAPLTPAVAALLAATLVLLAPRVGWLVLLAALGTAALASQRPGAALVIVIAGGLPVGLLAFAPTAWPLAAGAPALGMLGLAGAWPALAARAGSAPRRAALGLIGWIWLALASPLVGTKLYVARARGTPPAETWTVSAGQTVHHVLAPLLSSGALAPAPVWALGALVLPWLIRGRSLGWDTVLAAGWAVSVVAATTIVLAASHSAQVAGVPRGAVLGAVASALLAVAPTASRSLRAAHRARSLRAGLA